MRKPLIGVAPQYDYDKNFVRLDVNYVDALAACGALPVMLPLGAEKSDIPRLAAEFDGFLFPGGPDFLPARYGQETLRACGRIDHRRDALEFPLLAEVLRRGKPMLGICRGMQLLNVVAGGDLWQDLPTQLPKSLKHDQERPFDSCVHRVQIAPETLLADILPCGALDVNSLHHQAVRRVAPGLLAAAHTADGVTEAVCGRGPAFALGVQWHPELLFGCQPQARAIFAAFVDACRENAD